MNIDDNSTKIVIGIIALLTILVSGALISIKKIRKSNSRNTIKNIDIRGNRSKVIGGDDYSRSK